MPAGRPRKPENIRQRNHQLPALTILPCAAAKRVESPEPPKGLLKSSRQVWADLFASPVARAIDLQADSFKLHRYIQSVDEYQRVFKAFRRERVVQGSTKQPVINPLAGYLTNLEATITRIETEFGLGPLSRMRLGIATGQAALTAEELNRRLDEAGDEEDQEPEGWEAEWEQA